MKDRLYDMDAARRGDISRLLETAVGDQSHVEIMQGDIADLRRFASTIAGLL